MNLDNYNDVPSRIAEFREKHPDGTLQQIDLQFVDLAGKSYVVYTAGAFRDRDDPRPGMGTAWEPVPGPTSFTKDSEVQNAETSAWGRAIIAAGAADARKIASREEIQNRNGDEHKVEKTPQQRLALALADSQFTPPVAREIIGAALGRLVTQVSSLNEEDTEEAIAAVESAVADRLLLEMES